MDDPRPTAPGTPPPVLAGRYEVGELLGSGGTADVRSGWDRSLHRRVAIKLLRPPTAGGAAGAPGAADAALLEHEARAVASLNHPHVVAVHDIGTSGADVFVVMELVAGRSLALELAQDGPLPVEEAVRVVTETASALDAAHRAGLVHLDVKPSNVMRGPDGAVKLMDFGIAAIASRAERTTGVVVGTPAYMSPEQVRGDSVDRRSDVYSLGCCAYEVLTGRPPFPRDDAVETAWAHLHEPPEAPTSLRPDLPPAVDAVLLRALAKEPDARQQSAGELADDLARAVRVREGTEDTGGAAGPGAAAEDAVEGADDEDAPEPDRDRWRRRAGLLLVVAGATTLLLVVVLLLLQRVTGAGP